MNRRGIYVTGLSCRFPESDSPNEFFQNLLNKRDMVTADSRRWKQKIDDLPNRFGKIKQDLNVFDFKFFNVHGKQAEKMDPQLRLLLEVSYEALIDAGMSLDEMKGSKTGVYIGACSSDAHKGWLQNRESISGYEHTGCASSMLANRLSFFYNIHGPSETVDTACSSSLVAFHRAVQDLETGVCETAIVGGSSMILWPHTSYAFHKLKMLSPDGACKSFDQSANGYARSEGIAVLFLTTQKKNRYRPYAKILGSGINNGGWNSTGITFPNGEFQKELYRTVCKKAGLEPKELDYIEAHGTGTVAGDGEELGAIYDIYGKENPHLIIGSVKSNMGHCEGASGLAGLIKTMLCMEQEILVPNLHLEKPHEKLKNMKVMTDVLSSWGGSRAAISSFGFGGTNAHVIVEKCKELEPHLETSGLNLSLLAHRTKEGLYQLKNSLLAHAQTAYIPNAVNKQKLPFREVLQLADDPDVGNISDTPEKIFIACSGNGSQWKGMGMKLYAEFPLFKKAIDRCGKAVGKDLFSILKEGCKDALEATVALVGVQIGLLELLNYFGIQEDKIGGFLGHSAGEIVCSYLDKLTNLEETMKIALARGATANQTGDEGLMASIGLSQEKMKEMIRENGFENRVAIACINSPNNMTISGYRENVLTLVEKANEKEIFNRVLDTFGKAYHSFLFLAVQPTLEAMLDKNMNGKSARRSEKWLTSISNYQTDLFDYKYHVEGVLRPVDFAHAVKNIPQNSVVLEIGPHSVLRSLIKENRPDLKYASFMKRDTNELETLKEGLGKLWKFGINIDVKNPQESNVKRPPLEIRNQFVSWDHTDEFPIPKENDFQSGSNSQAKVTYNLSQDKDLYLEGHAIDGKILLPATSYLCAMWDVFRKDHQLQLSDPATYSFTDFEILQAVQVEKDSNVELNINRLGSQYELSFKDEVVARANIERIQNKIWKAIEPTFKSDDKYIDSENFYRIVANIGYQYGGEFKVIDKLKCNFSNNTTCAFIKWSKGNWITFLDGVLQCQLLPPKQFSEELRVPVRIRSLVINPQFFCEDVSSSDTLKCVIADFDTGIVSASGIEVSHMETKPLSRSSHSDPNKIEIKNANGILFYGRNIVEDKFSNDYGILNANYAIKLCGDLIRKNKLENVGHYQSILKAFQKWDKYVPVTENEAAAYRNRPECIALRILEDCYQKNAQEFLQKPLVATTQHSEHDRLYFEDPTGSLHDKRSLLKFLSVVRDNVARSDLNIMEIGTGTGGFTRLIAPYMMNDQYIATDITQTSQIAPDKRTEHLNLNYETFNLNNYDEYGILQKYDVDLILASNSLHTGKNVDKILKSIYSNLKEGGFVIFYEHHTPFCLALWGMDGGLWSFEDEREYGLWISQESWIRKIKQAGLEVVSYYGDQDNVSTLFLVRKPLTLKLELMDAPSVDGFEKWSKIIKELQTPSLLIAQNIDQSGVAGLVRSLNREVETNNFYCLSTDRKATPEVIEQVEKYGLKINILRNGRLGAACDTDIQYDRTDQKNGYYLKFSTLGDFGSYQWLSNPPPKNIACNVKYASLNFKDIMLASGKVSKDAFSGLARYGYIGLEFSGHDANGNRFMGITNRGVATQVDTTDDLLIPIPPELSYEDAATIPVVYGTAYYALFDRAGIQPGHSILIHAGTGGVGQAAIRICLSLGCRIFVTCHQSKKGILKDLFPQLDDASILDSRSIEFEREIMKQTNGEGVNIVLNSLADDKLQASLRCLAREGHFLEIGKYDLMKHTHLDMNLLLKNTTIHGVDLDQIFVQKDKSRKLCRQISQGMQQGVVKPLPRHVFDYTQVEDAFRFMASGKHIGKVLVNMEGVNVQSDPSRFHSCFHDSDKEDGFYLITGGLGGFGLALVKWFYQRGARKFLLTSRKGIATGEQQRIIDLFRHQGAEILISTKDVAIEKEAKELIDSVQGKIKTVCHLAMVLEDGLFKNMTQEKWEKTVHIKAKGAIHLDRLTRVSSMKHFIVFSSAVSRHGNIGQSNYAFGNAVMEEVCRLRADLGFHALAIQWGVIDNVGFVANNVELCKNIKDFYEAININDALKFIEDVLVNKVNSHSIQYSAHRLKRKQDNSIKLTFEEVLQQICKVIKMDLMKCNANDTLEFLGVDSLQIVEIQTILIKAFQEVLPLKKISSMKIFELKKLVEDKLGQEKTATEVQADSKENKTDSSLLRNLNKIENDSAVYLFLGYGINDQSLKLPKSSNFNLTLVAWHNSAAIEPIIAAIENDVKEKKYKNVSFLTHSAGYHVAKAVMNQNSLKVAKLVSISLLNEEIIQNAVNVGNLENIPDSVFKEGYRNAAFYVEDHLPIDKIKQQSMLISKLLKMKYIPPHLVINPREDTICDRSKGGIEISGNHQVDSYDMKEVFVHL